MRSKHSGGNFERLFWMVRQQRIPLVSLSSWGAGKNAGRLPLRKSRYAMIAPQKNEVHRFLSPLNFLYILRCGKPLCAPCAERNVAPLMPWDRVGKGIEFPKIAFFCQSETEKLGLFLELSSTGKCQPFSQDFCRIS